MTVQVRFDRNWSKVLRQLRLIEQKLPITLQQALLREAHHLRSKIVEGIDAGGPPGHKFAPHAPLTLAVRNFRGFGGTKILVGQNGALRGGVNVVKLPGGGAFVGVHRSARAKDGKSLVRIASIHEEGRSWEQPMTPRQRRFLMAVMRKAGMQPNGSGGGGVLKMRIPARPFIGPVLQQEGKPEHVRARIIESILELL